MRLSRENDRKLTQMIWRERAKRIGVIGALAAVLVGGAVYFNRQQELRADPTVTVGSVEATVVAGVARGSRKGYIVHARVSDGREVDAWVSSGYAPVPGTHVILAEAHHKSGKLSYEVIRTVQ